MTPAQIGGRILDQNPPAQIGLRLIHMPAHDFERFLGHWQRQEVSEIAAVDDAPREVLRYERRLDAQGGLPDAFELRRVETFRAAERQPDAVQRDRVVGADSFEAGERLAAAHVVLGMDFQPSDVRPCVSTAAWCGKRRPIPAFAGMGPSFSCRQQSRYSTSYVHPRFVGSLGEP